MRKAAIYVIFGPIVLSAIVAAIIFVFPSVTNSALQIAGTLGVALAITEPILRTIARTGTTEARRLSNARARLSAHIQNHWSALQFEMTRSVEIDPFGKILKDRRADLAAYFLKSTAFDYAPLTKGEAIRMIVEEFPVRSA